MMVVADTLEMLVTGDPLAEIDAALAGAAARLGAARATGDEVTARRLTAWIDYRLDQRLEFDDPPAPRLPRSPVASP
jgi:hypothetical protein